MILKFHSISARNSAEKKWKAGKSFEIVERAHSAMGRFVIQRLSSNRHTCQWMTFSRFPKLAFNKKERKINLKFEKNSFSGGLKTQVTPADDLIYDVAVLTSSSDAESWHLTCVQLFFCTSRNVYLVGVWGSFPNFSNVRCLSAAFSLFLLPGTRKASPRPKCCFHQITRHLKASA